MKPRKTLSTLMKVLLIVVGLFAFAFIKNTDLTTAQSGPSKRQLDDRVPAHLPIKIKIKKDKEEKFQDLTNKHWARDFELEVKNTGNRPIYALSLVWIIPEVKMPDGNPYGASLKVGRNEFITVPGETPKPGDEPIRPGESHIFKLSDSTIDNWESWAEDNQVPPPQSVLVFFNFLCFGDGTGWESPDGRTFERKRLAFHSPNKGDPGNCGQKSRPGEYLLASKFSIMPASFGLAEFLFGSPPSGVRNFLLKHQASVRKVLLFRLGISNNR